MSDADLLNELEEHAKGLVNSMVETYIGFHLSLDELTHTGSFTPTANEPRKAFDEDRSRQLVTNIKELNEKMIRHVEDWKDFERSLVNVDSGTKDRIAKIRGESAIEYGSLAAIEAPSRLPSVHDEEHAQTLKSLTSTTRLAELVRQDSEAWEGYSRPLRWLEISYNPRRNTKKKVEKERDAAFHTVTAMTEEKAKLRKSIRELFPVFKRADFPSPPPRSDNSSHPAESSGGNKKKRKEPTPAAPMESSGEKGGKGSRRGSTHTPEESNGEPASKQRKYKK